MKKTLSLLLMFAALLPLSAKPAPHNVRYALPRTVVTLKIDIKEQRIVAGPCAEYAQRLLGLDVPERDTVLYSISGITLSTYTEPDCGHIISYNPKEDVKVQELCGKKLLYLEPAEAAEQSSSVSFPVRKLSCRAEKGLIEAKAAADQIENYRQDIYNITIGNTDAAYQGEALGAAIAELHEREKELLKLFTPKQENYEYSIDLSFVPEAGDSSEVCINAFRFGAACGLLPEYSNKGELYTIEIEPDPYPASESMAPGNKQVAIEYRLPLLCTINVIRKGHVVCSLRAPLYQLGIKETLILQQ